MLKTFINPLPIGGPPPVLPVESLGSLIELDLLSTDVTVANGNPVGAGDWLDRSGHARNPFPLGGNLALRPTAVDGASPNGSRMVRFDGTNDELEGPLPAFPPGIPFSNGFTVFAYLNCRSLTTGVSQNGQLIFSLTGLEGVLRTADANFDGYGVPFASYAMGDVVFGTRYNTGVPSATGFQMLTFKWNPLPIFLGGGGKQQLYKNGIEIGTIGGSGSWDITPSNQYLISGNAVNNVPCAMDLGRFVVVSKALPYVIQRAIERSIVSHFES
jgi:hypothetical protein